MSIIWIPPDSSVAEAYAPVGEIATVQVESEPPNDYELSLLGITIDGANPLPNLDGVLTAPKEGEFSTHVVTVVTAAATIEVEVTQITIDGNALTVSGDLILGEEDVITVESEPEVASATGGTGAISETTTTAITGSISVESTSTAGDLVTDPIGSGAGADSSIPATSTAAPPLISDEPPAIPSTSVQTPTSTTEVYDPSSTSVSTDQALFDLMEQGLI